MCYSTLSKCRRIYMYKLSTSLLRTILVIALRGVPMGIFISSKLYIYLYKYTDKKNTAKLVRKGHHLKIISNIPQICTSTLYVHVKFKVLKIPFQCFQTRCANEYVLQQSYIYNGQTSLLKRRLMILINRIKFSCKNVQYKSTLSIRINYKN